MLKEYSEYIDGKEIRFKCNKNYDDYAQKFLKHLLEENKVVDILRDKFTVQIGWSSYFIEKGDDVYRIYAPDFDKNPLEDKVYDLSKPFHVQMLQDEMLEKCNCKGSPVSFKETVIVLKDALKADEIYVQRTEKSRERNSGWYIGVLKDRTERQDIMNYDCIKTYELLKYKPVVLSMLSLDEGCFGIIKGNEIAEIVDRENTKIYKQ